MSGGLCCDNKRFDKKKKKEVPLVRSWSDCTILGELCPEQSSSVSVCGDCIFVVSVSMFGCYLVWMWLCRDQAYC